MGAIDADFLAKYGVTADTAGIALEKLADPLWRVTSGELYKIIVKEKQGGDDDAAPGLVVPFKPNRAQRRFIKRMWHRNIILKARQLGFTTLICILWLDFALFNANVSCGIVAHNLKAAGKIFRDKVKFAYDNMPPALRELMPIKTSNSEEILFAHNGSSIAVAVSLRSGTYHRLHISEYGKICAKAPDKAAEVKTGTLPSCPQDGICVIESTAEGSQGHFHDMTQIAIKYQEAGTPLTKKDYRFHFFAWHQNPEYWIDPAGVIITAKDHKYFDSIEAMLAVTINDGQRAWYVKTREADFADSEEDMWQEYPSTPTEAFQQSTEGNYYAQQMTTARKQGRLLKIPVLDLPVFTFWDIGNGDGTAIWFLQFVGMEVRAILYEEAHGESLRYWAKILQDTGFIYGTHFLPHDAGHKRLSEHNKSIKEMLEELLPGQKFEIVPRIENIQDGIQYVRQELSTVWFDKDRCKLGINRLDNYKKAWNERQGRWHDHPQHDINSEGADAFRQYAQAKVNGQILLTSSKPSKRRKGSWRTT